MTVIARFLTFLFVVNILLWQFPFLVHAQNDASIYVCILPLVETSTTPYLITFREADEFGLIFPQDAEITIYSHTPSSAVVYSIDTDAQTGGYRRVSESTSTKTKTDTPGSKACAPEYPDLLTGDLSWSDPMRVSKNHAVIIEKGEGVGLRTAAFSGVVSIHFDGETSSGKLSNFQIIQLNDPNIEVGFPFINHDIQFFLISNKAVGVRISLNADSEFSVQDFTNTRSFFIDSLSRVNLDLYQMMQDASVRIYPYGGREYQYPTGGFIRFDLPSDTAERLPHFNQRDIVKPLDGTRANYYLVSNPIPIFGTMYDETDTIEIIRVGEDGKLIGRDPNGESEIILESWLVEVVLPSANAPN